MKIYIDADACPVVDIAEKVAAKYMIPVTLLCDTNHILHSDYSEVIVVDAGADAVDYKLISLCTKEDIVVTQDYGVAAMALGKGCGAIHQSGKWYTNENIDQMLLSRHLNKKARRSSHKNHLKGPKKRTHKDGEHFESSFERLILSRIRKPVVKASICTGEQVAGFLDTRTGRFEDVMLINDDKDLKRFKSHYHITGDITKIY